MIIIKAYFPVGALVSSPNQNYDPGWVSHLHVFSFLPMPMEKAEEASVTVNGLWSGLWSAETPKPIQAHIEWLGLPQFQNASEYVSWMHKNGMKVVATIALITLPRTTTPTMIQSSDVLPKYPKLENAVCKDINGDPSFAQWEPNTYWMCHNNPLWTDWIIERAKDAVDAGVDIVLIDDIPGNRAYSIPQPNAPGFCEHCMKGFKEYLNSKFDVSGLKCKFGIEDIEGFNYARFLKETGKTGLPIDKLAEDSLFTQYLTFQEESCFSAVKEITGQIRDYAKSIGREIFITGNFSGIETSGLRIFHLAPFFDFLTAETYYVTKGGWSRDFIDPPRGKWLVFYKQARAITNGSFLVTIPEVGGTSGEAVRGKETLLLIRFAEAYASQGYFAIANYAGDDINNIPKRLIDYSRFVIQHRDLYEESVVNSKVAVLDIYTRQLDVSKRQFSSLGLIQALAESNIPFEIIFDGDGYYIPEGLTLERLEKYKVIFLASALGITKKQKEVTEGYVSEGGVVILSADHSFGVPNKEGMYPFGKGRFIIYEGDDIGLRYWCAYNDQVREQIASLVNSNLEESSLIANADRTVVLFPYCQPEKERMIIHMVNYDYDAQVDEVNPKEDIQIQIKRPRWLGGRLEVFLVSPDFKERISLQFDIENGYIGLSIPKLNIYDVIVIESKSKSFGDS